MLNNQLIQTPFYLSKTSGCCSHCGRDKLTGLSILFASGVWAERISLGTAFQFLHWPLGCDLVWTQSSLAGRIIPGGTSRTLLVMAFWLEVMANIHTRAYVAELGPSCRAEAIWVPAYLLLSISNYIKAFLEWNNPFTICIILLCTVLELRLRDPSGPDREIVINWWLIRKNVSNLGGKGRGRGRRWKRQSRGTNMQDFLPELLCTAPIICYSCCGATAGKSCFLAR